MKQAADRTTKGFLLRRRQRFLLPLTVVILVSLACSLPNLGSSGTAPTLPAKASQSAEATQKAPVVAGDTAAPTAGMPGAAAPATPGPKYAPTLVEVDPLPQSELRPGMAPIFYFDQPMERASVESAFKTQPALSGRFEWLNDATVRFTPGQPYSTANNLNLTINTGAKAVNGLALTRSVQVSYQAAGPLRLAERLPAPDAKEVNPSSAVVVTFNRPVVPLGGETQNLPPAFSITPAVNGRGEWLNTSTYIYYPQPGLKGGLQYVVRLNSALTSLEGAPLATDTGLEWTFNTAAPVLLSVKPATEQPIPLDSSFTLTFNQPMDTASVEGSFSLLSQRSGAVAGKFSWNTDATELTFKPDALLQRGSSYTLALFGTAKSQGGAPIGRDFAASLAAVPQFAVTQTKPAAGETLDAFSGYGSITLNFSSPVAAGQDFNHLITLTPAIINQSVYRDPAGYQLFVSGYFQPSTSYTLSAAPELLDKWGATLGTPFSFTFTSQPAQPALVIPVLQVGSQALFVPQNETSIPAQVTNINRVNLSRGKLTLDEFIQAVTDGKGLTNWESKVQANWPLILYPKENASEAVNIPLTSDSSVLDPGLYFLKYDPQPALKNTAPASPTLVVVSPIQMVFKTSSSQAFIWAVRTTDNKPVANMVLTVYNSDSAPLGNCTTDTQGSCSVAFPAHAEPYKSLFAVHGQPGDQDFSLTTSNWFEGVAPWDFNLAYQDKGSQLEAYMYTDRPIYRPGQAVNFRVVVRGQDNGRYTLPALKQVTVDVIGPYDVVTGQSQTLTSLRLPLDPYGSASGIYSLPEDASAGSFTLRVQEVPYAEINFEVAEYRKPEIDLQVKFAQSDLLVGKDDIQAQVTARYFFGAPAGNLAMHWTLFRNPGFLQLPDGLTAGKMDTGWLSPWNFGGGKDFYIMDGQAQTAPDGTAVITIPAGDLRDRLETVADRLQDIKLEVTIQDESGLPVSARAAGRLHPSPYYIGVRPEQWSGTTGQEITYTIRSVDWQGNAVGDKPLSARFRKVEWVEQDINDPAAPPTYLPKYTEIGTTDFHTSPQGEARLAFTPAEPGTFQLEVTGDGGPITQILTWVGGAGSTVWPNLANQRLPLQIDTQQYQPGQNAHIFIPNPYQNGALALVTVERAKVMRSMVIEIQGASYDLQLPLTKDDAPNVYVSVTLLGRSNGRPDFRMGYVELAVSPASLLLQVEVQTSPQPPQPGGDVTVNIRVKDADGKPVQGEFSLALIDKAVLALADPNSAPVADAFYGKQPLGVQNSLSLAVYSGRFVYGAPGRGGGGGEAAVLPVRATFADTAYWSGTIQTDVTGIAQITVKLPDNLTTWRADVRGLTADSRVGQAAVDLVATKPLLIRPVTPRFVVVGDHIELAAVVNNNTQDALNASVRMEGSGFALDDPNQAVQPLTLAAGDHARVSWRGTVQDAAALDLTFSVEAGALRDAARPETGSIPVERYTAQQTFGTAGLLASAGQQLEIINMPRSFTPTGGELRVELTPSLPAMVLEGLKVLDAYPFDFTEPILSRLLPNLAAAQLVKDLQLDDTTVRSSLDQAITESTGRIVRMQNADGGWGWAVGYPSDAYISSYAMFGLSRAAQAGVLIDPRVLQKGRDYLVNTLSTPNVETLPWQLDRLAFQYYILAQSGRTDFDLGSLYGFQAKLSPWGKAFLALTLDAHSPGDQRVRTLISDLEASASRSATGANWQDSNPTWHNWSTPGFTTAVVVRAIAQLDPTSKVLVDGVRYLILNRQRDGGWLSSYETAWVLMALVNDIHAVNDTQANYAFSAQLNASPLLTGKVESPVKAVKPVSASVPLSALRADAPNALLIQHDAGSGVLYYRAFLQVGRPAQDAPAIQRGLALTRQYYRTGPDCRKEACPPVDTIDRNDPQPLLVRLTLTVPEDMAFVVVEDYIPAGTEVLNPRLKTSQQNIPPAGEQPQENSQPQPPYDLSNPFDQGWGWWLFKDPQVYDDHIRWTVDSLPAGTYELTYRLTPFLSGEFRVIPAHAWQYYFPDIEGTSKGSLLTIK